MRILLLGSGGREHALAWKLNQSVWANPLYIAPGNPGTEKLGVNVSLDINDFTAVSDFCLSEKIELVVVGPEEPLVNGLWDHFQSTEELKKIAFIGPSKFGAQLEGSKAFAKAFMERHNIPTAKYREFNADNFEEGLEYLKQHAMPVVLKADGLAAGKGVIICHSAVEAVAEFELMIQQSKFGDASKTVVVEEFLDGIEMSVFVLTDGRHYLTLPEAKDYKRIGEGDTGLNTGGMGAVSPVPFATPDFMKKVEERIIKPTIDGLFKENIDYTGFVFIGLIKVKDEPFVIEYNCRMGDPETEVVMPRLETDLVELLLAASQKKLDQMVLRTDPRAAVTVMAVSHGYPGSYEKGFPIEGLDDFYGKQTLVFQAGTKKLKAEGKTKKEKKEAAEKNAKETIVTNGGRVLCVTSYGENIEEAAGNSLDVLMNIYFDGMYYRSDIGYEFITPISEDE